MSYLVFLVSAVLLSFERLAYYGISNHSQQWMRFCERPAVARFGDATAVVQQFFYGFKIIQIGVFVAWCMIESGRWLPLPVGTATGTTLGVVCMAVGMVLNFSVFQRLGAQGVFYGRELGVQVPWVTGFPFSAMRHPQYIGTVLAIWGFFLFMRYPHADWYALPLLETVYYIIGAYYEP